jgi:hypothetical protein
MRGSVALAIILKCPSFDNRLTETIPFLIMHLLHSARPLLQGRIFSQFLYSLVEFTIQFLYSRKIKSCRAVFLLHKIPVGLHILES